MNSLELALATEANVIVTGDPDLLVLDPWRGVRTMTMKDFIREEKESVPLFHIS